MKSIFGYLSLSLFISCGGGTEELGESYCETTRISGATVNGYVYSDLDFNDRSMYASEMTDGDEAISGAEITLYGAGEPIATHSCDDGSWGVSELEDGHYLAAIESEDGLCGQHNCPSRLPRAIEEGQLDILTLGDSVPVTGDRPFFPSRLKDLLDPITSVNSVNVAIGGTLSDDWLPDGEYFNDLVAPNLEETDVVVISVGGNDILGSIDASALADPDGAVEDVRDLIADTGLNVIAISEGIRAINPDVDVVFCLYVNYELATISPWDLLPLVIEPGVFAGLLEEARDELFLGQDIILVDLFGASFELDNLDDYLFDALHFNDYGHTFYAEEVFKALGGVLVGDNPLSGDPRTPLGLERSWSFVPQ
jgi:lysophospholipase L1-like esterase